MRRGCIRRHDVEIYGSVSNGKQLSGKIAGYIVKYVTDRYGIKVRLFDGHKPILNLTLEPRKFMNINVYAVSSMYVHPEYQGNGIGLALYKNLILKRKLTIISTGSHSIGARKTWLRASQDMNINAYGFNSSSAWKAGPNKKKTELTGLNGMQIYGRSSGLMLTLKGGNTDKIMTKLSRKRKKKSTIDIFGNSKFYELEFYD